MGCLCGLDDQAVQDLIKVIDWARWYNFDGQVLSRLEILKEKLLQVEVNDGN